MTPVTGNLVSQWVNARMPFPIDFGLHEAIGFHRDGKMILGAVYNNYHRKIHGDSIDVTFATAGPGSITRGALRTLFTYAFGGRIVRLQAITAKNNKGARKLLEGLGFTFEGVARKAWDGKQNAILYSCLRDECRWIDVA